MRGERSERSKRNERNERNERSEKWMLIVIVGVPTSISKDHPSCQDPSSRLP